MNTYAEDVETAYREWREQKQAAFDAMGALTPLETKLLSAMVVSAFQAGALFEVIKNFNERNVGEL